MSRARNNVDILNSIHLAQTFGAVGNGVTNDTTAFLALEATHRGSLVDLDGLTYLVSAVPSEARYFNGAFKVGSVRYDMPFQPLSHPLDSAPPVVIATGAHYWPGPVGHYTSGGDDLLLGAYSLGQRHEATPGAPLLVERSYGGDKWEDAVVMYANDTYEARGLVGGMISATRFGVMALLVDSAGSSPSNANRFFYADSASATVTTVSLTGTNFYPHGNLVADDSGGVSVYGTSGSNIMRARTTDSGATWTVSQVDTPSYAAREPAVIRIGANKHLRFDRDNTPSNARVAYSTDGGATWSGEVDSNITVNANPMAAVVAWGRLYLYVVSQRSEPVEGQEDKLLLYEYDPDALFTAVVAGVAPPAPAPRLVLSGKTALIGYLSIAPIRPPYFIGYLIDGETVVGSTPISSSRLVQMGGIPAPLASPALLSTQRRAPPITQNNDFTQWSRGTSFTGILSGTKTVDRWAVGGSTATVDVTREAVTDVQRVYLPWRPTYCTRIQSAANGSGRQIYQRFYGKEQIQRLSGQVVTGNIVLSGTAPGYIRFGVNINFGSGGSATKSAFANMKQPSVLGGFTWPQATISIPAINGDTIGTNPYIDFYWLFNNFGAMDAYVFGAWADRGDEAILLDPTDPLETRQSILPYTELVSFGPTALIGLATFGASTSGVLASSFSQKISTPSILIAPGFAASDFLQNGSTACSGVSFDLIGLSSARTVLAGVGFSTGVQELRTSANGAGLLIDAGVVG